MLGDATRHDARRSVVAKRMLEARAGGGFLKTAAGRQRERTGGGTAPVPEPGTETGTGGLMTSEVNRKRKSSGYVATGWDRSTRFVSSGLLVSFELTRQCQLGPWTIRRRTSGPLGLWALGRVGPSVICRFPILAAQFQHPAPSLYWSRPGSSAYHVAAHHMQPPRPPLPCHPQVTHNVVCRTAPTARRTTAHRTSPMNQPGTCTVQ